MCTSSNVKKSFTGKTQKNNEKHSNSKEKVRVDAVIWEEKDNGKPY